MGSALEWVSSLAPRTKAREVDMRKWGVGGGERGVLAQRGARPKREKTKMPGLCKEEPLGERQASPWAGNFRVGSRVCQIGTGGCWKNLEVRCALVCKICTSVPCPRSETKQKQRNKGDI